MYYSIPFNVLFSSILKAQNTANHNVLEFAATSVTKWNDSRTFSRCNVLIRYHILVHIRRITKWVTRFCTPVGCAVHLRYTSKHRRHTQTCNLLGGGGYLFLCTGLRSVVHVRMLHRCVIGSCVISGSLSWPLMPFFLFFY